MAFKEEEEEEDAEECEMEESLERLRKEFPEMDPTVLEEALVSHSNNYFRASEALKVPTPAARFARHRSAARRALPAPL